MAFTKADVANKQVNGEIVEIPDDEKQVIADQWNTVKTAEQRDAEEIQRAEDKSNAKAKLKALGLTDAEITALTGGA